MSTSITVPATPSTANFAQRLLAAMAALTGVVPTDFNKGSQVRTFAESAGSVNEAQGVWAQALALQAAYSSAANAFGITASGATPSFGTITLATVPSGSPFPIPTSIDIPAGTFSATQGGIQFQTLSDATFISGASTLTLGVQAVQPGPAGNVPPNTITNLLSNLGYPLFVTASAITVSGVAAEIPSQTQARLAAKIGAIGLASPYAVANAAVGVATAAGEKVLFAECYEPWIAAGSGAGSGIAGFTLFVDNGTGGASSGLVAAVNTLISGNVASGMSGYRPAGVPYNVQAGSGIFAVVVVSGTLLSVLPAGLVSGAIASGVAAYFAGLPFLPYGVAEQPQLAAIVANNGMKLFSSLSVQLFVSGSGSPVPTITGNVGNRVILSSYTAVLGN